MTSTVTVKCLQSGHPNEVRPVVKDKPVWPDFEPYRCSTCASLLIPTPAEWHGIVSVLATNQEVPASWWQRCDPPHPVSVPD